VHERITFVSCVSVCVCFFVVGGLVGERGRVKFYPNPNPNQLHARGGAHLIQDGRRTKLFCFVVQARDIKVMFCSGLHS